MRNRRDLSKLEKGRVHCFGNWQFPLLKARHGKETTGKSHAQKATGLSGYFEGVWKKEDLPG